MPQIKGSMLAGLVSYPTMESFRRSLQSEEIHFSNLPWGVGFAVTAGTIR